MGRNKKHKKELRSEKSKTQLKTKLTKTKFLPKGLNVTNTNFKIKPIVIREQLKSSTADETGTKKKHNLKDLLTRLNHHNTTMRYEACENLIDLILSTPTELIEQSLHIILQGVSKLVIDAESKVRQKAIKVLSVILNKVSNTKVIPFFDILTSYVLCAMTHIDKHIQEDSLLLIDVFLEHVPGLIVKDFHKLFCNFLTLISKLRSDSNLSRTLTVNLSGKFTSIKWRIKVLSRLNGILNVAIQRRNSVAGATSTCKVIKCEGVVYIPLYRKCDKIETNNEIDATLEKRNEIDYVKVLLPLLYETWAEAVPLDEIKYNENGAMLIDQDAASVLTCILGIFRALMDFIKNSNNGDIVRKLFSSKEYKLMSHFLNQFPYRQHEHRKKVGKELNKLLIVNTDFKCTQENLIICYIFCVLNKKLSQSFYREKVSEVLKYINICLISRNYVPSQSVNTIVLVLRVIFFENLTSWQHEHLISSKLLDNVVIFHNNLPADSEQKMEVFNLLVDIAKEPEITRSPKFLMWLRELPLLLLKPELSIKYVDVLSLLARQNNVTFIEALRNALPEFLYNLLTIKIINDELPPGQIKLINMLYYVPNLNWRHIDLLRSFVEIYKDWTFVEHVNLLLLKRS